MKASKCRFGALTVQCISADTSQQEGSGFKLLGWLFYGVGMFSHVIHVMLNGDARLAPSVDVRAKSFLFFH